MRSPCSQELKKSETLYEVALRVFWPECVPRLVPGPRRFAFGLLGPKTSVPLSLPEECEGSEEGWEDTVLGFSPLAALVALLGSLVETLAIAGASLALEPCAPLHGAR